MAALKIAGDGIERRQEYGREFQFAKSLGISLFIELIGMLFYALLESNKIMIPFIFFIPYVVGFLATPISQGLSGRRARWAPLALIQIIGFFVLIISAAGIHSLYSPEDPRVVMVTLGLSSILFVPSMVAASLFLNRIASALPSSTPARHRSGASSRGE